MIEMNEKEKIRLNNILDIVEVTVNDLVYIGTKISHNQDNIEIQISFGNKAVIIPIEIRDIIINQQSPKNFLALITESLEAVLEPYIERNRL